jgi:hypothetical protein
MLDIWYLRRLRFDLPRVHCPRCGLVASLETFGEHFDEHVVFDMDENGEHVLTSITRTCKLCAFTWPSTEQAISLFNSFKDIDHLLTLADIASKFPPYVFDNADEKLGFRWNQPLTPNFVGDEGDFKMGDSYFDVLLEVIRSAKSTIHLLTFGPAGVDVEIVDALRAASVENGVIVRGVVGTKLRGRPPVSIREGDLQLLARPVHDESYYAFTHSKLIVVDGLVALKGSANLQRKVWDEGMSSQVATDFMDAVTDLALVAHWNNKVFVPIWLRLLRIANGEDDTIAQRN